MLPHMRLEVEFRDCVREADICQSCVSLSLLSLIHPCLCSWNGRQLWRCWRQPPVGCAAQRPPSHRWLQRRPRGCSSWRSSPLSYRCDSLRSEQNPAVHIGSMSAFPAALLWHRRWGSPITLSRRDAVAAQCACDLCGSTPEALTCWM